MAEPSKSVPHSHQVQFYWKANELAASVAALLRPALLANGAAVVIATPEHSALIRRALGEIPTQDCVRWLDARATLDAIFCAGTPDAALFSRVIVPHLVWANQAGHGAAVAYGEMVALLWAERRRSQALDLEKLWNAAASLHPFDLICGYPMRHFASGQEEDDFLKVCAEHTSVLPTSLCPHETESVKPPAAQGASERRQKAAGE